MLAMDSSHFLAIAEMAPNLSSKSAKFVAKASDVMKVRGKLLMDSVFSATTTNVLRRRSARASLAVLSESMAKWSVLTKVIKSSIVTVGRNSGAFVKSERCVGRCTVVCCDIDGEIGVEVGVLAGGEGPSIVQIGRFVAVGEGMSYVMVSWLKLGKIRVA